MSPWKIVQLKVLPHYRLEVVFRDGTSGIVDLSNEPFDGVFAPFADPRFFAEAALQNGTVVWPGGLDIAPDAMYHEVIFSQNILVDMYVTNDESWNDTVYPRTEKHCPSIIPSCENISHRGATEHTE
ncbi:hypothetical protein FACS18942_06430 [Planctomycetales bacterium]|nr:hypothetical protein FACS18942_06430 [Planctomycetales bacterium]